MNDITQEVDPLKILRQVGRKNKRTQAVILQEIEKVLSPESMEYQNIRKVVLDELNSLTRSYVRSVFGDIEFMI